MVGLEGLTQDEELRVSEGALFLTGRCPMGCNLERGLESDSVWVPELMVAIPTEGKPFLVNDAAIYQEGTSHFIMRDKENGGGGSVWYANEDVKKTLNLCGFVLVPGSLKSGREPIYVFENAFIPDESDPNQERLDVQLVSGLDDFGYIGRNRGLTAHVREKDILQIMGVHILSLNLLGGVFGYDCEHNAGGYGLNSRKNGSFECSLDQLREAYGKIEEDLRENLGIS